MIVVLDYNDGKVYLYDSIVYQKNGKFKPEQIEEFIDAQGHQLSNCNWMESHEPIQKKTITESVLIENSVHTIKRVT